MAGHLRGHDLEAGLGDAALLIPLPQIKLKIGPTRQCRQNLVILRTKLHRNKLRRLTIRQHNNFPLLKHRSIHSRPFLVNRLNYLADLIYGAYRLRRSFAHREQSPGHAHIDARDSLSAFNARDESLGFVYR